jgi:hypothetical protein
MAGRNASDVGRDRRILQGTAGRGTRETEVSAVPVETRPPELDVSESSANAIGSTETPVGRR